MIAAYCGKLVDSLAPSLTTILCEQKQLTLGVFGHEEISITDPIPPAEIGKILYSTVFPVSPREAVLQGGGHFF